MTTAGPNIGKSHAFVLQDRKRLPVRFFPAGFGTRLARLG
tara:strand:+ start:646 stop:765 length:120 start_codon:yes stop_codon:yes gene_type:complete